jgi:hypothetical protein
MSFSPFTVFSFPGMVQFWRLAERCVADGQPKVVMGRRGVFAPSLRRVSVFREISRRDRRELAMLEIECPRQGLIRLTELDQEMVGLRDSMRWLG